MGSNNRPSVQRLYYRIGEVAQMLDLEPSVLRHWEHEFRTVQPSRTKSGQRVYSQKDIRKLENIKRLLHERHFTTKGAIKELQRMGLEPRDENDPLIVGHRQMRETLVQVKAELEEIAKLLRDEDDS